MKFVGTAVLVSMCISMGATAGEQSSAAATILQQAKSECAGLDGGEFHATEEATTLHDLTGDGRPEEIVDAARFSCSSAASLWGGSGGTYLWAVVDGKKFEFLAHAWRIVDMGGQKILLLAVHSSQCGDTVGPCYRAVVWGGEDFRTVR